MVNPERGEVELKIGDEVATLSPEMARFANVSHALKTKSLADLLSQIQNVEPYTMYACLDAFVSDGDVKALKQSMTTFKDLSTVSKAMLEVISALMGEPSKNEPSEADKG